MYNQIPISRRISSKIIKHSLRATYFLILLSFALSLFSQNANHDYKHIKVEETEYLFVGIDDHPNGEVVAISGHQSYPFVIYNWKNEKVVKTFDIGNWYAGSVVSYSSTGKYLTLQQLFFIDMKLNKDREVNFEILDAETGEKIKHFSDYHAVRVTADEKNAIAIKGQEVSLWSLPSGEKSKSFKVDQATNAVAIHPDGSEIAVAHWITEGDLKNYPQFKKNKKALKSTLKFKQQVSIFNAETFERKYTVNEFYDIVYDLQYAPDGKTLFCLQIPHEKAQTSSERQTYISTVDAESGEPRRRTFSSKSVYEPDYELSHDGRLLGVVSKGVRFNELHIYDFESGKMLKRFELSYRLFEKDEDGMLMNDGRTSFAFLPGDESILMVNGNRLILWNLEINK